MITGIDFIIILIISVIIDWVVGDPVNKIHPVAWIGKYISYFIPKIKENRNRIYERKKGIIFTFVTIFFFAILIHSISIWLLNINIIVIIGFSIFILY